MNIPTREEFLDDLKRARVVKRLIRDIRYAPEEITHPTDRDFLVVSNKSGNEGVLLYEGKVIQFELQRRTPNVSGRVEAIICDICATWQRGTASAIMTIKKSAIHTATFLVCADLECSLHVRDKTQASKLSRTQLREHITLDERITRLKQRLRRMLEA